MGLLDCCCCWGGASARAERKVNQNEIYNRYNKVAERVVDGELTFKNINTFVPAVNKGVCIKVYDGDTITIAAYLPYDNSPLYKFSVRLNGIDTPEIKGCDADEKAMAIKARDALSAKILNKVVDLENVSLEKYGRLLATIKYNDEDLNAWLIKERYALAYDGGTKATPKSWQAYHETGEM